ncbi:hypothetical protein ACIBG8_13115 [Nonomuraea sp. NPDC050556]|uniref:hypothetical protein n=1 Tax=Nonomuraea sp. NPDC050556 TaxID=3364369 RepID=UPI003793C851
MYIQLALALALTPISSWGPVTTPDGHLSMDGVIERTVTFSQGPNGLPVAHPAYAVKGYGWLDFGHCGTTAVTRQMKAGFALKDWVKHPCRTRLQQPRPRIDVPLNAQLRDVAFIDVEVCSTGGATGDSCATTRIYG